MTVGLRTVWELLLRAYELMGEGSLAILIRLSDVDFYYSKTYEFLASRVLRLSVAGADLSLPNRASGLVLCSRTGSRDSRSRHLCRW